MNIYKTKAQKDRLEFAEMQILELGYDITFTCNTRLEFYHNRELVRFFPYTGWHTGKSIEDGRGLNNLLKQLK